MRTTRWAREARLSRIWYALVLPVLGDRGLTTAGQRGKLPRLRPHGPLLHPIAHLRQLDRRQEDPHRGIAGLVGLQRSAVPEQPLRH